MHLKKLTGNRILFPGAAALLGLCLFSAALFAEVPTVPDSALHADEQQERATEIILHIIDTYHYKKKPLDDELSSQIFDNYLDALDGNRNFFTQQDINRFEQYRYLLDDDLKDANLSPAYDIFLTYRKRVDQWIQFAEKELDDKFNFDVDEDYQFDRRESPWSPDEASLREQWRKRVKNDVLNLRIAGKKPDQIKETLMKRYQRVRTSTYQLDKNDVFQTYINAYTTAIEPHTSYFSPRTSENFDISMRLSLEGIGAVLRAEGDYTQVQRILPGGPADLSGLLHAEDRIVGVGQEAKGDMTDVIGWRLDDVVDLIRGPKGTTVRLEILPSGSGAEGHSKNISLVRDKIKLEEQEAKAEVKVLKSGGRIGIIDIPTFYSDFAAQARGDKDYTSTSRDVRKLLADLQKQHVDGIIIDLRENGGGSLAEALELTGLFIESGPIVQTRDSTGRVEINRDPDPGIAYGGPLAVLVDRNSASASEIFTGAIQDYHRGIIIGEPTFGKGTVQNVVDLNRFVRDPDHDYGRLKTTIAQFYRISGGSNQFKGVIPDIIYPTAQYDDDQGERSLHNALPWDKVAPARYVTASAPISAFDEVRRKHEQRIRSDKLFQLLIKEAKFAEEANKRTTVSLEESKREAERKKIEAERLEIQNAIRQAQGLPPLTDKQADADDNDDTTTASLEGDEQDGGIDVVLDESAKILYDLITPMQRTASNAQAAAKIPRSETTF